MYLIYAFYNLYIINMQLVQIIGHTLMNSLNYAYRGDRDINPIISLYCDIKIFVSWHHLSPPLHNLYICY